MHPVPRGECSAMHLYCVHYLFSLCFGSFTTFISVMLCRAVPCCAVLCRAVLYFCSCLRVIPFSLFFCSSSPFHSTTSPLSALPSSLFLSSHLLILPPFFLFPILSPFYVSTTSASTLHSIINFFILFFSILSF